MEEVLKQIRDFADKSHGNQMRKYTPERYIVHPERVMKICRGYSDDVTILAAALLHDVLEDTPVTQEDIHDFLLGLMDREKTERTVGLVVELTDVYVKEDYPQWNRRKRKERETARLEKTSADSQTVKYADIIDNSAEIIHYDTEFAPLFLHECRAILKKMTQGHPELYKRAIETVDRCIAQLWPKGTKLPRRARKK
ncbi:MAG TPA: HD domain-containing protein [Chitinophagaceae bacterium]